MGRLDDAVAIVTGGAGGIGAATCRRFAAEGASVMLTDLNGAAASELAEEIGCHGMQHDVTDEASWETVLAVTMEVFGTPTILVNNAGIFRVGPITEVQVATIEAVFAVNVTGVLLGIKQVAAAMKGGSIVNISSVAGVIGAPHQSIYGGSKGAVRSITKSAAVELARVGVRVNAVHPAIIDTPMATQGLQDLGLTQERLERAYPMRRFGRAEEVANAVLFLASDEASYITGAELAVDGGLTAT